MEKIYHFTTTEALQCILKEDMLRRSIPESLCPWRRVCLTDSVNLHRYMPKVDVRLDLDFKLLELDGYILVPMNYSEHHGQYAYEHEIYCESDIRELHRYVIGIFDVYEEEYIPLSKII